MRTVDVGLGSNHRDGMPYQERIQNIDTDIIKHEGFGQGFYPLYDIALVKLPREVPGSIMQPIPIRCRGGNLEMGTYLLVTGFGRTEYENNPVFLKYAYVEVIRNSECDVGSSLYETVMCAKGALDFGGSFYGDR